MDKAFDAKLFKRLEDRRKAIDEKLSTANIVTNRRRPRDNARAERERENRTPNKEVMKTEVYTTSVTTSTVIDYYDDKTETEVSDTDESAQEKENTEPVKSARPIRDDVMNRLKKLGSVYAGGDNISISSPIHRTEDNFLVDAEDANGRAPGNQSAGLTRRLAALADTINQREDDLRHVSTKKAQGFERCESHSNLAYDYKKRDAAAAPLGAELEKSAPARDGNASRRSPQSRSPVRDAIDECNRRDAEAAKAEAGSKSPARVESPGRSREAVSRSPTAGKGAGTRFGSPVRMGYGSAAIPALVAPSVGSANYHVRAPASSPNKPVMGITSLTSSSSSPALSSLASTTDEEGGGGGFVARSPARSSVRQRAAMYESVAGSPGKSRKENGCDPAELPLSQRKALFEKNSGAPVLPKAPIAFADAATPSLFPAASRNGGELKNKKKTPATSWSSGIGVGVKSCSSGSRSFGQQGPPPPSKLSSGASLPPLSEKTGLSSVVAMFEQSSGNPGALSSGEPKDHMARALAERQKELEMLKRRWDEQKGKSAVTADSPVPAPPPLPSGAGRTSGTSRTPQKVTFSPTCTVVRNLTDVSSEEDDREDYGGVTTDGNGDEDEEECRMFNTAPKTQTPKGCGAIPAWNDEAGDEAVEDRCPMFNTARSPSVRSPKDYPGLCDMKPIVISPPKPGNLYPNLSDMEMESDVQQSEIEEEDVDYYRTSYDDDNNDAQQGRPDESNISSSSSGSFGRQITEAAHRSASTSTLKNLKRDLRMSSSGSSDLSSSDSIVNDGDLDEFLDEALGRESPTPPKRSRSSLEKDGTLPASESFQYRHGVAGSPRKPIQPNVDSSSEGGGVPLPTHIVDGASCLPLQHTVSFYRRNQTLKTGRTPVSPRRQFVHRSYCEDEGDDGTGSTSSSEEDICKEQAAVERRMRELQQEVYRQEAVISQTSQALNLCSSTIEFSGSTEQVEAERLLLVATHKRRGAMLEIQRLQVEGSLRPVGRDNARLTERGDLVLSEITLPLKMDNIKAAAREEKCFHLICLVKCGPQVLSTSMVPAMPRNLRDGKRLTFPCEITLEGLYSDFKVTVEVYALSARSKEVLPHDIKYHISVSKKDTARLRLTPKKICGKHHEDKLTRPNVMQSPGGPAAVRSPQFELVGYVVFSLREINRTYFTLNKVPYTSVLDGTIHLRLGCQMSIDVECRGFLTMFDDISGLGAWHRRWCLLHGDKLSYWKYPDDEKKRIPIDTIDLNTCVTERVGLVSRDICARPHTFLLESSRPRRQDDEPSLILIHDGNKTIIRHLLSADSREDRAEWCDNLNRALALLRAWGKK